MFRIFVKIINLKSNFMSTKKSLLKKIASLEYQAEIYQRRLNAVSIVLNAHMNLEQRQSAYRMWKEIENLNEDSDIKLRTGNTMDSLKSIIRETL